MLIRTPIAKLSVQPTKITPTPNKPRIKTLTNNEPTKQIAPIEKMTLGRR
jgi:hypothetical protein